MLLLNTVGVYKEVTNIALTGSSQGMIHLLRFLYELQVGAMLVAPRRHRAGAACRRLLRHFCRACFESHTLLLSKID